MKPKESCFLDPRFLQALTGSLSPKSRPHSPQILVSSSKCHFIILLKPLPLFTGALIVLSKFSWSKEERQLSDFLGALFINHATVLPECSIYSGSSHVEKVSNSSKPCTMIKESSHNPGNSLTLLRKIGWFVVAVFLSPMWILNLKV